jgi:hypothetical protein
MSITHLIIMALCAACWFIGYKTGHRDGWLSGRKALRKFYDQRSQVRI